MGQHCARVVPSCDSELSFSLVQNAVGGKGEVEDILLSRLQRAIHIRKVR